MSVLHVQGLRKILGAREILRDASLRVEAGERVGVVGRNGEGKTTFLRLVQGELAPDGGSIHVVRGARLGHVEQRPSFPAGTTVRAWVEGGLDEVHRLERALERTAEAMAGAEGDALDRLVREHGELSARMEFLGGWESERRVETVLSGIGLPPELWDRDPRTLSGGEKSRAALARELVSVPDLLLLDEPTNHLDLAGIEWLEGYLVTIRSAVLVVSHDRRLLDRIVDAIVEVERGTLERYPGGYSQYVERKSERFRAELRAWEQQQEHVRKEEAFIRRHMGSQRTGEAKGRRKKLGNLERVERPHLDVRRPVLRMARAERGGELVLEAEDLAVGHGEPLLVGASVRIGRGDRIGVVGPNGAGKTTLLRVLAGRAAPLGGELRRGHGAACGYYDQETSDLRPDGTPYGELRRDHPRMTDEEVRGHLARFLFRGADVDKPVAALSGGERARLSLARLVLSGATWLALDEPTNHLDLAGRTALEEMLSELDMALVAVSHDRAFLDGLCTSILEVSDGGVRTFRGNYTDYRRQLDREREEREAAERERAERRRRSEAAATEAARAKERAAAKDGRKAPPRNPWRVRRLEEAIIALEEEREALHAALGKEEVYTDAERVREAQVRLAELERDLDEKNAEWERLA